VRAAETVHLLFLEKILHQFFHDIEKISAAFTGDTVGIVHNAGRQALYITFRRDRQFLFRILPAQEPRGQFFFLLSDEPHTLLPKKSILKSPWPAF